MNPIFSQYSAVCECWSQVITSLMRNQWQILDSQYAAGIELLDAAVGAPTGTRPAPQTLEQKALECAHRGLPPPREVYQAQNRSRIDWSQFPEWARPIDPEVFEGTAHEG